MAQRQPEGPPPPPVVQRVRLRYAKRGRLRFTSHRDIARVVERAVRRSGLPIAFSAGFNPHPRISWLGAAPTGVASEAEYAELALAARLDPTEVAARLDAALPPGLDVLEGVEAAAGALADRIEASEWLLALPGVGDLQAADAVRAFLAQERVVVLRRTKDGSRELDAREAVLCLEVVGTSPDATRLRAFAPVAAGSCAILRAVVRHSTPVVRPEDVLVGMRTVASLDLESPLAATRLAQGPLVDTGEGGAAVLVSDPLAPDRVAREQADAGDGTA